MTKTQTITTAKKATQKPAMDAKPVSQRVSYEIDQAKKTLVIESLKVYAKDQRADIVRLSMNDLEKTMAKITKGNIKAFWAAFYPLTRPGQLQIDSKSEKLNLCKHARARQHCFNVIARAAERPDLVVEYSKAAEGKPKTEKKAKAKKT